MNTPSKSASLVMLQALANYLDQGSSNATLIFYDDAKPASITSIPNQDAKVLELNLPEPCVKEVHENNIELFPSNIGIAIKTGTVTWARLFNGAGIPIIDISMETDIVLDNYNIVLGSSVKLDVIYLSPQT